MMWDKTRSQTERRNHVAVFDEDVMVQIMTIPMSAAYMPVDPPVLDKSLVFRKLTISSFLAKKLCDAFGFRLETLQ